MELGFFNFSKHVFFVGMFLHGQRKGTERHGRLLWLVAFVASGFFSFWFRRLVSVACGFCIFWFRRLLASVALASVVIRFGDFWFM